eukprot:3318176-Lingulodinium_polyedra.AAC.1
MDLLAQRILAVQTAKRKGGRWGKAEALEVLPPTGTAFASGAMVTLVGRAGCAPGRPGCRWRPRASLSRPGPC